MQTTANRRMCHQMLFYVHQSMAAARREKQKPNSMNFISINTFAYRFYFVDFHCRCRWLFIVVFHLFYLCFFSASKCKLHTIYPVSIRHGIFYLRLIVTIDTLIKHFERWAHSVNSVERSKNERKFFTDPFIMVNNTFTIR